MLEPSLQIHCLRRVYRRDVPVIRIAQLAQRPVKLQRIACVDRRKCLRPNHRKAATIRVCKRFPHPLEKGAELTIVLTCDMENIFLKKRESVIHLNVLQTPEAAMVVELPRPVLRQTAF